METQRRPRTQFGEKLRAELDRQQISIRKLARVMAPGSPEPMRRNLARWIGGYNQPSRIHRIMVADALGLPLETFTEDDEEPEQPVSLDEYLRLKVRDVLRSEREVLGETGRPPAVTLLPEEIDHYAWLIAGLIVSAARARTSERLAEVHGELEEALRGLIARLDVSSLPDVSRPFSSEPLSRMRL